MYAVIRIKSIYLWLWSWCPFVLRSTYNSVVEHMDGNAEFLRTALKDQQNKTAISDRLLGLARKATADRDEIIDELHRKLLAAVNRSSLQAQLLNDVTDQWRILGNDNKEQS